CVVARLLWMVMRTSRSPLPVQRRMLVPVPACAAPRLGAAISASATNTLLFIAPDLRRILPVGWAAHVPRRLGRAGCADKGLLMRRRAAEAASASVRSA